MAIRSILGRKFNGFNLILACTIGGLVSCGTNPTDDSSLTVNLFPVSIQQGDTTSSFTCTKQVRNTVGRMETEENYSDFYWVSGDSAIVQPQGRTLIGKSKGTTKVVALDKISRLKSDSLSVTVQ